MRSRVRSPLLRTILLGTTAAVGLSWLGAAAAAAASATWTWVDSDWNNGANWSTGTTPSGGDVGTFDTAPTISVTVDAPATSIGTIRFAPTADSYLLNINNTFAVTGGIRNESSNLQTFFIFGGSSFTGGTTSGAVELHNFGSSSYANASAGSATIVNSGTVDFGAGATAGNAAIANGSFATINFNGGSTAGNATITNGSFGFVNFNGDAKAGTARINNFGGFVNFNGASTAENATIVNDGIGSTLTFNGTSTAAQTNVINTGGMVIFNDSASAGSATIANDAGSAAFRTIQFNDTSTAGGATITTGNGARINFFESSTGGTATLVANGGGAVRFFDSALGDRARLIANAGGSIEINALAATGTTAGSIEGAGTVRLGGKTLTVGFNDLSTTFSGAIQGNGGSLVKVGAGTLILSGLANTYTGTTVVNGGRLQVDGSITSSSLVTVNAGGTLGGTGRLQSTVISGGTLSPGNSIGTITVQGSLVLSSAATYLVEISPSAADRSNVTGAATLGGTVQVAAAPGSYASGTTYPILTATGGVSGTFAGLTGQLGSIFLTASLGYDANNVYLTISQIAFASVGQTRNQIATATAVEALGPGDPVFDGVFALGAVGEARQAFDALSGEVHASLQSTLLDDSFYVRNAVLSRLRAASYAGGSGTLAALGHAGPELGYAAKATTAFPAKLPLQAAPSQLELTFWTQGFGAFGRIAGDGNAAEAKRDLAGVVTGFDRRFGDWTAGLAAGYSRADIRVDARASAAEVESAHFAGYAGASFGAWTLRSGAALTWHAIDTHRTIAFPGFVDRTGARHDGDTAQVFGEIGYGVALGGAAIEPFAGLAFVRVRTDGFNESGGAAALSGASKTESVGYSWLGVRAASHHLLGNGMALIARASLAWQHAFGEVTPTAALAFAGNGIPFTVAGVPIARDAALVDAGFDLEIAASTRLGLGYVGRLADTAQDHAAKGSFRVQF